MSLQNTENKNSLSPPDSPASDDLDRALVEAMASAFDITSQFFSRIRESTGHRMMSAGERLVKPFRPSPQSFRSARSTPYIGLVKTEGACNDRLELPVRELMYTHRFERSSRSGFCKADVKE